MSDALIAPVDDTVDALDEDIDVTAALQEDAPEAIDADAPDPTDDAPEDGVAEASSVDAPVVEAERWEPFTIKGDGQVHTIDGLTWNAKSRTFRAESDQALLRIRQVMGQGRDWEFKAKELTNLRRANAEIRDSVHADIEQAKVYLEEWQKLMNMPEDQLWQFVQAARTEWPKIEARAERTHAERLYQRAQAMNQPPEPDVNAIAEEARESAAALVQNYLQDQPWASPDVREELVAFVQDMDTLNQFVGRAKADIPDQDVRAGQYFMDRDRLFQIVERYAKPYRAAYSQQTTAAKQLQTTHTVATRNAAALSRAKPNTPAAPRAPTPSTRPRPQDVVSDAMKVWREMSR